jgi:hypothetical protein
MYANDLFTGKAFNPFRKKNGRFATPEQAMMDKLRNRNQYLEYQNEMLKRKLSVFEKLITERKLK